MAKESHNFFFLFIILILGENNPVQKLVLFLNFCHLLVFFVPSSNGGTKSAIAGTSMMLMSSAFFAANYLNVDQTGQPNQPMRNPLKSFSRLMNYVTVTKLIDILPQGGKSL